MRPSNQAHPAIAAQNPACAILPIVRTRSERHGMDFDVEPFTRQSA